MSVSMSVSMYDTEYNDSISTLHNIPSVADTMIDYATTSFATNHAQVPEPIGSLYVIVGLATRITNTVKRQKTCMATLPY